MPDAYALFVSYVEELLLKLAENLDRQMQLTNQLVPLVEEARQLGEKIQDQYEELQILVRQEKTAVAA
jgi:hypothetical protein